MRPKSFSLGMKILFALVVMLLFLAPLLALPASAQEELLERLTPQSWGEWAVVFLTIGLVQLIKMILPSPEDEPRWAAKVTDGINRILPYAPILVAAGLFALWNRGAVVLGENGPVPSVPIGQLLEHGAALGVYAAYLYRAGKVTVFGK